MAISQNFAAISPTLSLNFARSKALDPRITFTRTTTGTVLNERGVIETIPAGNPRFDHAFDSTTGSIRSLGLLIEESRINLFRFSEQFDNAAWTKINCSITANTTAVTSPDGSNTSDKIVENTVSNALHYALQASSSSSGVVYTFSVFVKSAERTNVQVGLLNQNSPFDNIIASVNLSNGEVSSTTFGTVSNSSVSTILYPNGWYRVIITGTIGSSTSLQGVVWLANTSSGTAAARTYTGDGTSGIYIWGAQLEAGAFASSYIPTTNTTITRTPDNAFISGTNFSNWYNEPEGTIFVNYKVRPGKSSAYDRVYSINLNSTPGVEEITLVNNIGYPIQRFGYLVYDNSSAIQDSTGTNNGFETLSSNNIKTAMWYKSGNYAYSFINGSNVITGSPAGVPSPNTLDIGRVGAGDYLNGTMSQFVYYPRVFTSYSHLERLTK